MEKHSGSKISKVHFKNKDFGWNRFSTRLEFENGKSFEESLIPQEPYKTFLLTMKEVPQNLGKIAEMEREVTTSVDNIYKEFKDVEFPFNKELFEELVNKIKEKRKKEYSDIKNQEALEEFLIKLLMEEETTL